MEAVAGARRESPQGRRHACASGRCTAGPAAQPKPAWRGAGRLQRLPIRANERGALRSAGLAHGRHVVHEARPVLAQLGHRELSQALERAPEFGLPGQVVEFVRVALEVV